MPAEPPTFRSVTPMIPAGADLGEAVRYYTGQLGFSVVWQDGDMAGIRRGDVSFHLVRNTSREWADQSSYSIGVSGLDVLYAEFRDRNVPTGALETKFWGRREFHMIVPSGVCLQFFEQTA